MSTTQATRSKSYANSKVDESLPTQGLPRLVQTQNKGSVCLGRTIRGPTAPSPPAENVCILRAGHGGVTGRRLDRPHLLGPRRKGSPSPPLQQHNGTIVTCNAARERTRVKTLRSAFHELQQALPCVPPNTKLSKLDVLVLATMYIGHLMGTLQQGEQEDGGRGGAGGGDRRTHQGNTTVGCHHWSSEQLHPVKKWPMRTRLYAGLAARARGSPPVSDTYGDHQAPDTNIYL